MLIDSASPKMGGMPALPDLNLLVTLDALLTEGSVARAAKRLNLSPSAMSRALARLREATGDPLLVRAGRGLVPTPRAEALRGRAGPALEEALALLRPAETLDLRRLVRTFTLRNREGFVENFGAALLARVAAEAPGVQLHFLPKPDRDSMALRDGRVDLETGVVGPTLGPELRTQALFADRFIGVVRRGNPLLTAPITAARYAAGGHIDIARGGDGWGPIDAALEPLGLARLKVARVGSFSEALALVRGSDLIASLPERYTGTLRDGMASFPLPFAVPAITISLLWHPRLHADPAHRWLRACVRAVCQEQGGLSNL